MNKKYFYLLIAFGLIVSLTNGCEKDKDKPITNIDYLTNNSTKVWSYAKIVTSNSITISLTPCLKDDEAKFQINGKYSEDNMGTIYALTISTGPSDPPMRFCKDTIDIINNGAWTLNTKMDTLTVSTPKYTIAGQILKLTSDSLILKRTYSNSVTQFEYFVAKK